MTEILDLKQEFITAKSKENIVAFAGFRLNMPATGVLRDGLLAISSRRRRDGSGYITLTFMIDTEDDAAANRLVVERFRRLEKKDLNARLGREFESMLETSVDFDQNENWFMDSFTFYFDQISSIKRYHVEGSLIPTFEALLPAAIDPVEWLPESVSVPAPGGTDNMTETSVSGFRGFLKGLFGA